MKNKRLFFSLIIFLFSLNWSFGAETADERTEGIWTEALSKWSSFADEHMERMKNHDLTLPLRKQPNYKFDMEWVEVKSRLITKYLLDYKIFSDRRFVFVLDKKGHIICLGGIWPLGRPFISASDFELKKYSEFIRGLKIQVNDKKTAIEMVKLKEIVNGYGDDKELELRERRWQYKVSKKNKIWYVRMVYVGPPASIMEPPVWKIELDQNNCVGVIKEFHLANCDVNGDRDCDSADVKKLEELLGECITRSIKFNVIADTDHDGCITKSDREYLIGYISNL